MRLPPAPRLCYSVDWKSFASVDWSEYSVASFCAAPIQSMQWLATGANTRKYVKDKLKKFVCRYGGKSMRSLSFAGTTMTLNVDFEAANYDEFARAEILKGF
jgi:hypothetical protein